MTIASKSHTLWNASSLGLIEIQQQYKLPFLRTFYVQKEQEMNKPKYKHICQKKKKTKKIVFKS